MYCGAVTLCQAAHARDGLACLLCLLQESTVVRDSSDVVISTLPCEVTTGLSPAPRRTSVSLSLRQTKNFKKRHLALGALAGLCRGRSTEHLGILLMLHGTSIARASFLLRARRAPQGFDEGLGAPASTAADSHLDAWKRMYC